MKCVTWAVRTSAYRIQNIAGTKSVHTVEDQVTRFSVNVCYSRQYVVAYCNQDAVSCTCDEMSGSKDRSVRTYGPKCLGIRTEMSGHFGTTKYCLFTKRKLHAHTIKLITHIMSHVCTTNKWNKPVSANTMSCDSVVLCSYYFYSHTTKTLQPALSL